METITIKKMVQMYWLQGKSLAQIKEMLKIDIDICCSISDLHGDIMQGFFNVATVN